MANFARVFRERMKAGITRALVKIDLANRVIHGEPMLQTRDFVRGNHSAL